MDAALILFRIPINAKEDEEMADFTRREFIKVSGIALGGIILTGCGGSDSDSSASLPNGYTFYSLKTLSDSVDYWGANFKIEEFLGSAYICDNGIITFDAEDKSKRRGIFQLEVDFSADEPKIVSERTALLAGTTLPDKRVVGLCRNYDVDEMGNIAAIIEGNHKYSSDDHFGSGLYFEQNAAGFEPLLIAGQKFNNNERTSTGIFYCASVKNANIIASFHHVPVTPYGTTHVDSLVHFSRGSLDSSNILISRGDYLAGTDYMVKSFGLLDHNDNGDFCATAFASAPLLEATESATSDASKASFNFTAHVNAPNDHLLLSASPTASVSSGPAFGESGYAPRIDAQGNSYSLLVGDNDQLSLVKNTQVLLTTGDASQAGIIQHIGTGSVGPDGTYYYSARTDAADWTLFAFDGSTHRLILSSGNILDPGGETVVRTLFGVTKKHVDSAGRLVFCCTFADGTTSLVVGIPS